MEFKDCKTGTDILSFFNDPNRAEKHTYFYHYTTLQNVDSILKEKAFRLTRLAVTANDTIEKKRYEAYGDNVFSLCFSTGTSESLPLWYLYSGIDGKGARIGLKKKSFLDLCRADLSLAATETVYPYRIIGSPVKLSPDDYDFIARDILYLGQDPAKPKYYRAKYNGQVINDLSEATHHEIDQQYPFIKSLIWFYEKETRIQVVVKNKALIQPNVNYVVLLDISDLFDQLSVRLAPEFGEVTTATIEDHAGIKSWLLSNIEKSDFSGQLKMGLKEKLCNNCKIKKEDT